MFSLLQININLLVVSLAVYDIAKLIDFHLFDPYFHVFYVLEKLSVLLFAGFKSTTHKHNHSFSFLPKTP